MAATGSTDPGRKTEPEAVMWSVLLPLGGQLYAEDWPTFWVLLALLVGSISVLALNGFGSVGGWAFAVVWFLGVVLNGRSCRRFNENRSRVRSP